MISCQNTKDRYRQNLTLLRLRRSVLTLARHARLCNQSVTLFGASTSLTKIAYCPFL